MNIVFNRKNTKKLIEASRGNEKMTLTRLNWLLENKNSIIGCIHYKWFTKTIFLIIPVKDGYKLYCECGRERYHYMIWDIEAFLDFIPVMEIEVSEPDLVLELIEAIKEIPSRGAVHIHDNKIFLRDFLPGVRN